jgi:hypothetical protein
VKGYLLAALVSGAGWGRKVGVKEFLDRALASEGKSYQKVGIGTSVRLATDEAVGAALLCEARSIFPCSPRLRRNGRP